MEDKQQLRLVWQVAEADTPVLRNVGNLLTDIAGEIHDRQIEVVAHGEGIGLVLDGVIPVQELAVLRAGGVQLLACATTMRRKGLRADQLASGTRMVPSGIGHLVRRQMAGWSYLRA